MSLTRYLVAFYRKNVQVSFSVASFMCPRLPSEELKTSAACNFFLFFFLVGMSWMKRPSLSLNVGETPGPLVCFLFCCFAAIPFNKFLHMIYD